VPNWTAPEASSWCELTQEALARLIYGQPNRKRVMRLLRLPAMQRWVQRERGWRTEPGTGRRRRGADRYRVAMAPPPIPGDEAVPIVAMGERLIREGNLLPGDAPAAEVIPRAVSTYGTQPVGKMGETPWPPVSLSGTDPGGKVGEKAPPGPTGAPVGQQDLVVNDDVQSVTHLSALLAWGMARRVAVALVAAYPADRIQRNLDLLRTAQERIKNPPAWLRAAIEQDYADRGRLGTGPARPSERRGQPLPAPAGREGIRVAEERAARATALYEALPPDARQRLREKAERALREEYAQFGPGARVGEGAVLARVHEWLLARDDRGGAAAAPTPADPPLPYPPAQVAAQFYRWYGRRHRAAGVDMTVPIRAPGLVRARRVAWAVMQRFGASLREIGAIAGVDKTTVQYGLRQVQHRPEELAEGERWMRQFLEALQDFTVVPPSPQQEIGR
jgi:hypothetical protein